MILQHLLTKILSDSKNVGLSILHLLNGSLFPGRLFSLLNFCLIYCEVWIKWQIWNMYISGILLDALRRIRKTRVRLKSGRAWTFFRESGSLWDFVGRFFYHHLGLVWIVSVIRSFLCLILTFFLFYSFLLYARLATSGVTRRITYTILGQTFLQSFIWFLQVIHRKEVSCRFQFWSLSWLAQKNVTFPYFMSHTQFWRRYIILHKLGIDFPHVLKNIRR